MRTQLLLLAIVPGILASPVPTTSSSYLYSWETWQSWELSWLQNVAPQIKCSSSSPSSAVSPYTNTNCTASAQSTLITLFATKWQPYIDAVFTNIQTQLSNITTTQSHIDTIITSLKQQFAGDMITSLQQSLYAPSFTPPTHLEKRHGDSKGTPLSHPYQNYTYQGCMTNFASKALLQMENTDFANLTNEKCIDHCKENGYAIAGTQSGSQCFCGNNLTSSTLFIEERACATSCTGNDTEVCGDNQKLSVYATYNVTSTTFDSAAIRTNWTEVGCVTDGKNGSHALTGAAYACLGMTVEMCMNFCDVMGFPVAGLEYGGECYCGNKFENEGGQCSSECTVPCIGDSSQLCGGDWKMNVYERVDIKSPLDVQCGGKVELACSLGNCTQYNFTGAWAGETIDWTSQSVLVPNTTDVCSRPGEIVTYYPYFIWQMHENLRAKIADRLKVDWPARIAGIVGDTCQCEINDITKTIADCGNISYGLDGIAESWLCDVISLVNKI